MVANRRAGANADRRGEIAESTFRDLLGVWMANVEPFQVAQLQPDTQRVDFRVTMPSLWSVAKPVQFHWQVKSVQHRADLQTSDSPIGCPSLRYQLSRDRLAALYETNRSTEPLLLALAMQRDPDMLAHDLLQVAPAERFDWYVVDLGEYFRQVPLEASAKALHIPIQNRLNLATYSLLWSAHWVKSFFGVLNSLSFAIPQLVNDIRIVFDEDRSLDFVRSHGWDFLQRRLPSYEREFDTSDFSEINFKAGLASALAIIRERMFDAGNCIDVVRNYCPESLFGSANLWLFSTTYHHFMRTTGLLRASRRELVSERLLPLPEADSRRVPRLLLTALWHVMQVYRALGTEVRLVDPPSANRGEDYSYYGGGIGYFPWISLADDKPTWQVDVASTRTMRDNIDFLDERLRDTRLGPICDLHEAARLIGVRAADLALPDRPPRCMFPREDTFLRHPVELFQPRHSLAVRTAH